MIPSIRGEDIEINPCFFREKQYSYCTTTSKNNMRYITREISFFINFQEKERAGEKIRR